MLTLIDDSGGFGDQSAILTNLEGVTFDCYVKLERLVSGPTRTGSIKLALSEDGFGSPIAFYNGSMGTSGTYTLNNVPENPPDVPSAIATLDAGTNGNGLSVKVYRWTARKPQFPAGTWDGDQSGCPRCYSGRLSCSCSVRAVFTRRY